MSIVENHAESNVKVTFNITFKLNNRFKCGAKINNGVRNERE